MQTFTKRKNILGIVFGFNIQLQEQEQDKSLQIYVESVNPTQLVRHVGNNPQTLHKKLLHVAHEAAQALSISYRFDHFTAVCSLPEEVFIRATFYLN